MTHFRNKLLGTRILGRRMEFTELWQHSIYVIVWLKTDREIEILKQKHHFWNLLREAQ